MSDITISVSSLIDLIRASTVTVRDTSDNAQDVISATDLINGLEGIVYREQMKRFDVLVGMTLDEAYKHVRDNGLATGIYVERERVGNNAPSYPEHFVDFVRRNINPDVQNFEGFYFKGGTMKKGVDYTLPKMRDQKCILHVTIRPTGVIREIAKFIED